MSTSDNTPPDGLPAALRKLAIDVGVEPAQPAPDLEKYGDPAVAEVPLGGTIPRVEETSRPRSGDLYLRLEGQISGPFRPERLESLISSGILTGLEDVSVDLNHWTPLAYHPRIILSGRHDLGEVHRELRQLSDLPAKKDDASFSTEDVPLCAVVKKPRSARKGHGRPSRRPSDDAPNSAAPVGADDDTDPDFNRSHPQNK